MGTPCLRFLVEKEGGRKSHCDNVPITVHTVHATYWLHFHTRLPICPILTHTTYLKIVSLNVV